MPDRMGHMKQALSGFAFLALCKYLAVQQTARATALCTDDMRCLCFLSSNGLVWFSPLVEFFPQDIALSNSTARSYKKENLALNLVSIFIAATLMQRTNTISRKGTEETSPNITSTTTRGTYLPSG